MMMTMLASGQTRRHQARRATVVRVHEIDLFKTCSSWAEEGETETNRLGTVRSAGVMGVVWLTAGRKNMWKIAEIFSAFLAGRLLFCWFETVI